MTTQTTSALHIVFAAYGLSEVTSQVSNLVNHTDSLQTLNFTVSNETLGGDTWPNQLKSFTILFYYDGGGIVTKAYKEGDSVTIGQAEYTQSHATGWIDTATVAAVWGASYGPVETTAFARSWVIYTDGHRKFASYFSVTGYASNDYFGDTWPGVEKTFVIVVGYQNKVYIATSIWRENMSVFIRLPYPPGTDTTKDPTKDY